MRDYITYDYYIFELMTDISISCFSWLSDVFDSFFQFFYIHISILKINAVTVEISCIF